MNVDNCYRENGSTGSMVGANEATPEPIVAIFQKMMSDSTTGIHSKRRNGMPNAIGLYSSFPSIHLFFHFAIGGSISFSIARLFNNQKDKLPLNTLTAEELKAESLAKANEMKEHVNHPTLRTKTLKCPNYVFSACGSIGNGHLRYYLDTKNPPNREEIIRASFSFRKFQSNGSGNDTISFDLPKGAIVFQSVHAIAMLVINQEGQALSLSVHQPHTAPFINNEEIRKIHDCIRCELKTTKNSRLMVGYYEDGKCIIHQPGVRSCVYTSAAMILFDQSIHFDFSILYHTNMANNDTLNHLLKKYGYRLKNVEDDLQKLQEWICQKGSLLVAISAPEIGGHEVVLDAIDEQEVTIREPANGWRIAISRERFNQMKPRYSGIERIA